MAIADPLRASEAHALLSSARRVAEAAGVTRLADVTRLDRVGLPVWQAIRPASRALSVHQGKGLTHADAQVGALLEAIESDAAERYEADTVIAPWASLDADIRPRDLADFAHERSRPPSPEESHAWVAATRPDSTTLMVPFEAVSLDFTNFKASPFERASAGLATGTSQDEARRSALLELIERDAISRFLRARYSQRLAREVDTESVRFDWYGALAERIERAGLELRIFAPPSPMAMPVVAAVLIDDAKTARPYAGTVGHAAHPLPEWALFKAVSEALQSRLTFIAGSRDDCWPWDYHEPNLGMVSALAPPPNVAIDSIDLDEIDPASETLEDMIDTLTGVGVEDLAFLTIARKDPFHIVRAVAPGLGSLAKEARL